jgi:RNA exonuclease 1
MKFTPRADPKNQTAHDATKKTHMKFDDPDAGAEKKQVPELKKKPHQAKTQTAIKRPNEEKAATAIKKPKLGDDKKKATPIKAFENKHKNKTDFKPYVQRGPDGRPIKKVFPKKNKQKLADRTPEEIKKRVAELRQKKREKKRHREVDASGNVVKKPSLELYPKEFNQPLNTKKMGEFVLYALAEAENFKWCKLINKNVVENLVMVFCQGINVSHFGLDINKKKIPACVDLSAVDADTTGKAAMPFLTRQAKHMLVTKISGAEGRVQSPVADILQCPISNSKKLAIEQKMYDDKMKYKDNMRDYYILSLDEMKRADYPIPPFLDPSRELPEDWKETHPASEPTEKKKLIAVDCEMVLTEQGSELARLTLISEGK